MGAALSAPLPELSRHAKHRRVPHRPKKRCNRQKPVVSGVDHPQQGWERASQAAASPLAGRFGGSLRHNITPQEVSRHCTPDDAWVVLRGKVYDITPYLRYHPGGAAVLLKVAGRDGTALFDAYHPWVQEGAHLESCLVGWVGDEAEGSGQNRASPAPPPAPAPGPTSVARLAHPSQPHQQQQRGPPLIPGPGGGALEEGSGQGVLPGGALPGRRSEGQHVFPYRLAPQQAQARCELQALPPPSPPSDKRGVGARGGGGEARPGGGSELERPLLEHQGGAEGAVRQGPEAAGKVPRVWPPAVGVDLMVQACTA